MNLDDGELVSSIRDKKATVVSSAPDRCDLVMLGVERAAELRQIGDLSDSLAPGGAIWVVLPKTVRTVTKANVITAAREAGLSNVKTVDYSETQAAYKVIRPNGAKKRRRASGNGSSSNGGGAARKPRKATPEAAAR